MHLSNHHVLSSTDIDQLSLELGRLFTPHELKVSGRKQKLDAQVCSCAINDIYLSSFRYGESASVMAAVNEDQCAEVISLNFQLTGHGHLVQDQECHDVTADQGLVIDMQRPFRLELQGYGGVALVFAHDILRNNAISMFGEGAADIDFRLATCVDLTKPAGLALKNAVFYATNEMNQALGVMNNPICLANLENYLLMQLLTLHPSSFMALAESKSDPMIMPRNLKRAREYIHAHAHEKVTLAALASHAGCSYRSLQNIFYQILGMSPMEYLRSVRLEGVRSELLARRDGKTTVAEVANRWGFMHMGRLSRMYKRQYGVLPSDTLGRNSEHSRYSFDSSIPVARSRGPITVQ